MNLDVVFFPVRKVTAEHGGDGHDTKRGRHGDDYFLQAPRGQKKDDLATKWTQKNQLEVDIGLK